MNYYQILNVAETANKDEIKQAYRKLVKEYHPDKNIGKDTKKKFQEIQEAYEILSDDSKRQNYDARNSGGGSLEDILRQWGFHGNFANDFDVNFGGYANRSTGKGPDIRVSAQLTIRDIYEGSNRQFNINGKIIPVSFPKGIREGMVFKMAGYGANNQFNSNAPCGDLLITVSIIPSTDYVIQGNDIWLETNVKFYDMILGGKQEIETPTGRISFTIPEKSAPGKVLRIPGKGLPIMNTTESGSILIKLNTTFHGLKDSQILLINKIKELEHD